MKKIVLACAAAAALAFTSCDNSGKNVKLESDIDSLSYALGVMQAEQIKPQLLHEFEQEKIDSTLYTEFIKGVQDAAKANGDAKKLAYIYGLLVGNNINSRTKSLNHSIFDEDSVMVLNEKLVQLAFAATFLNENETLPSDSAMAFLQARADEISTAYQAKKYLEAKQKNEDYIAQIAKKSGIQTLGDGVYYEVLEAGSDVVPADTVQMQVHLEGQFIDGKKFESTYEREAPMPVTKASDSFVPGFDAAIKKMTVGSKWKVYIPWDQAYGESGQRNPYTGEMSIPPYSALIFTIEILDPAKEEQEEE